MKIWAKQLKSMNFRILTFNFKTPQQTENHLLRETTAIKLTVGFSSENMEARR